MKAAMQIHSHSIAELGGIMRWPKHSLGHIQV